MEIFEGNLHSALDSFGLSDESVRKWGPIVLAEDAASYESALEGGLDPVQGLLVAEQGPEAASYLAENEYDFDLLYAQLSGADIKTPSTGAALLFVWMVASPLLAGSWFFFPLAIPLILFLATVPTLGLWMHKDPEDSISLRKFQEASAFRNRKAELRAAILVRWLQLEAQAQREALPEAEAKQALPEG